MNVRRMDMASRKQYAKSLQDRYLKANKKEKGIILDEFCLATGHNREYAISKLNAPDLLYVKNKKPKKRPCKYGNEIKAPLIELWDIFDDPCGKRLKSQITKELDRLIAFNEITVSEDVRSKLLKISPSTIDRKLKYKKRQAYKKLISGTKPGNLKSSTIISMTDHKTSIKTNPGFLEIDFVIHNGGNNFGTYAVTLSVTDIKMDWWFGTALLGKGQHNVTKVLKNIIRIAPFKTHTIDGDCEFLNHQIAKFCKEYKLIHSRSRANYSNDNAFVEQKNWTHVRKMVGYLRHDTEAEVIALNDVYETLMLYKNFFQPTIKTIGKIHIEGKPGKRIREKQPLTPFERVCQSEMVDDHHKKELYAIYQDLNPAALKKELDRKVEYLMKLYKAKQNPANLIRKEVA